MDVDFARTSAWTPPRRSSGAWGRGRLSIPGSEARERGGLEPPACLAELAALPEAEYSRRSNSVEEDVAGANGVAEPEPGAFGGSEMRPVLRLEGIGNASKLFLIVDLLRHTPAHDVE